MEITTQALELAQALEPSDSLLKGRSSELANEYIAHCLQTIAYGVKIRSTAPGCHFPNTTIFLSKANDLKVAKFLPKFLSDFGLIVSGLSFTKEKLLIDLKRFYDKSIMEYTATDLVKSSNEYHLNQYLTTEKVAIRQGRGRYGSYYEQTPVRALFVIHANDRKLMPIQGRVSSGTPGQDWRTVVLPVKGLTKDADEITKKTVDSLWESYSDERASDIHHQGWKKEMKKINRDLKNLLVPKRY